MAGTGGGKSCILPLWLMKQIERTGTGRHLVVSPTYKIFKQSQVLDRMIEALEGTALQGSFHKTEKIYTCKNGVEIFFRSADTPDSLEGGQYKSLIIDEAAKISHDAWIKASARVGAEQGPILLVSTPDANNWIHSEVFLLCDAEPKILKDGAIRTSLDGTVKVIQWASTANPCYSKDELERQRRILPEAIFRRRYLGEFARLEGLVYETFADQVIEEPCPPILPSPAVKTVAGIDWGWNDPTSVIVVVEAQDGRAYIVEELYERQLSLDALAHKLERLKAKWLISSFYCDHSRPEIKDQLRRRGLPCQIKKVFQIETGIAMVDSRLRSDYLKIYLNCKNLIDEAGRYQRKGSDQEGQYKEKAVDKNNHALDALRYAITGLDVGRTMKFDRFNDPNEDELAAKIRLGQLSPDDDERARQEEKAKQERYIAWFDHWANAEVDD